MQKRPTIPYERRIMGAGVIRLDGGSLVIVVPKSIASALEWERGDTVISEIASDGRVIVTNVTKTPHRVE